MDELDGVEIVWFEEFYDGPLTGVARFDSRLYWFTPASETWVYERPRRFVLRELSESELADLHQRRSDSELLPAETYWPRYHPIDRDVAGFQEHDGAPVGYFTS